MSHDEALLGGLARAVRALRTRQAVTLRELAVRCHLSERFLVELESGRANISVVKLARLAAALGTTASALLSGCERPAAVAGRSGAIVALLGLRGAGKTTVGQRAAARLSLPFIELDALVEADAGTTLAEVFELHGTAYYRKLEREALRRLVETSSGAVLATGGSLVTDHESFSLLRRHASTIWLRAKPADHWERVLAQGDARPMANRRDAMNELRALLRARGPLYEQAEHVVDTSRLGIERSVDEVVRLARSAP